MITATYSSQHRVETKERKLTGKSINHKRDKERKVNLSSIFNDVVRKRNIVFK
jgi:hypothetical protein